MAISLRARVLILFSLVLSLVMFIGGQVLISNARKGVQDETRASVSLARSLAASALKTLNASEKQTVSLADLPELMPQPRHVRVHIFGLSSRYMNVWKQNAVFMRVEDDLTNEDSAPLWFDRLLRPELEVERIPLLVHGRALGQIIIAADPSAEISKVWKNARALALLMIAAFLVSMVATYFALNRALKPLKTISKGLLRFERGDYGTEISPVGVPELRPVVDRVNALGRTLDETIKALGETVEEKEKLAATLITVQDTERKKIALELHDEFGPCLFGIKSNATFLKSQIADLVGDNSDGAVRKVDTILQIVGHMQVHNKALLHRLRPMALEKFGLTHLLEKTCSEFREREPRICWSLSIAGDIDSLDETTSLTVFRTMQESMTNAARHADAATVKINISGEAADHILVSVVDDGRGYRTDDKPGLGVSGMNERVSALGGRFSIKNGPDGGTVVEAIIPSKRNSDLGQGAVLRAAAE